MTADTPQQLMVMMHVKVTTIPSHHAKFLSVVLPRTSQQMSVGHLAFTSVCWSSCLHKCLSVILPSQVSVGHLAFTGVCWSSCLHRCLLVILPSQVSDGHLAFTSVCWSSCLHRCLLVILPSQVSVGCLTVTSASVFKEYPLLHKHRKLPVEFSHCWLPYLHKCLCLC